MGEGKGCWGVGWQGEVELEGLAGWKGCLGVKLEVMEMMIQLSLGRDSKGAEMGVDSSRVRLVGRERWLG